MTFTTCTPSPSIIDSHNPLKIVAVKTATSRRARGSIKYFYRVEDSPQFSTPNCDQMKTFLTLFSPLLLAIAPLVGASPLDKRVVCPLYIPAPSPDPFEASALPGYYLASAGGCSVL
ncbi:hypothetical protein FRC00_000044 [Tulasnella sp. 408]|nr:hypothetical protein FRC00_000044 [Tulasnella sp. 408]